MMDLWLRDTWIMAATAAAAVLVVLPVQLLLCFKAKKLLFKLLPAILLAASVVVFCAMMVFARDWSALLYVILAFFSGVLLLFCGIAWGIWAIARLLKKEPAGGCR